MMDISTSYSLWFYEARQEMKTKEWHFSFTIMVLSDTTEVRKYNTELLQKSISIVLLPTKKGAKTKMEDWDKKL